MHCLHESYITTETHLYRLNGCVEVRSFCRHFTSVYSWSLQGNSWQVQLIGTAVLQLKQVQLVGTGVLHLKQVHVVGTAVLQVKQVQLVYTAVLQLRNRDSWLLLLYCK